MIKQRRFRFVCSALLGIALTLTACGGNSKKEKASPDADGVMTTKSGLKSKVLQPGNGGAKPTAKSIVTVHYSGWTIDGKMFDSSVKRGKPIDFPLNAVIPGWTEGLQLMTAGEKRRFWIPAELAYGNNPGAGKPAGLLIFDVELLGFK